LAGNAVISGVWGDWLLLLDLNDLIRIQAVWT